MKAYLCTCNNCGNIYIDNNPGKESILYEFKPGLYPELTQIRDGDEVFTGCPECKSDGYLMDNINYITTFDDINKQPYNPDWSQVCEDHSHLFSSVEDQDYPADGIICGVRGCNNEAKYYVEL